MTSEHYLKEHPMAQKTIPALPNHFPYNELLLNGKLSAKTRTWRWKHTGLTLLYTSTSTAWDVVGAHGLEDEVHTTPRMVLVGVGELLPVRELTEDERDQIDREFGNGDYIGTGAADYRYEFKNLKRFVEPVPFKPPHGAVRTYNVPLRIVAEALEEVGVVSVRCSHCKKSAFATNLRRSPVKITFDCLECGKHGMLSPRGA